jgi:kynurenine formamidase
MPVPSEATVVQWFRDLSNWGRWGADDGRGTLNLITPQTRLAGAALVERGRVVSSARTVRYDQAGLTSPQHFMLATGDTQAPPGSYGRSSSADAILFRPHTPGITHLDAPAHVFWRSGPDEPRVMYNGQDPALVSAAGADAGSVELAGGGIVSRGVLLDIARLHGVPWFEPGYAIGAAELGRAMDAQRCQVRPGDILLVRTGDPARVAATDPPVLEHHWAGLSAECLPWLREHDVAVLASDCPNDVVPAQHPRIGLPIHGVGIAGMGLWLVDNCDHEELAATCAELNRWEFLSSIAPIKWAKATGSPVNPLTIF